MIRAVMATIAGVATLCLAVSCLGQPQQQAPAGPTIINNMPPAASDSGPLILVVVLGALFVLAVVVGVWLYRDKREAQRTTQLLMQLAAQNNQAVVLNGQVLRPALTSPTHQQYEQTAQAPMLEEGQYR
jgi:hypothetical protein